MSHVAKHYRTCHLCEAMCGLEIEHDGARVLAIRGDQQDPFSKGHICPKAAAIGDIHEDPDRLRRPVCRTEDGWREITWDEAFDRVITRLAAIRETSGNNAVGIYAGNPNVHSYPMLTHSNLFLKQLKTRNRYSATSVDQLPHHLSAYWMFGHQFLLPIPDVDRTNYMLILGANPLASNGSLMSAPGIRGRLKAVQARGGKIVVIDPRRTETAKAADRHLFIQPGRDALFLINLINVLAEEGRIKPGPLAEHLDGFEQALAALKRFGTAHEATGITAQEVRRIAGELADAPGAVVYGRMGLSTQPFGTLCQWLINLLNIATGNLDHPGGAMFALPAFDIAGPGSRPGHFGVWHTRLRELPEFSGELPVSALAEEMLTPGEGQIKALITVAGNPVLSTPGGTRMERALENLEFMVAVDFYINETTRFADIILPPASPLERDHYDMIFHALAVRNTSKYAGPLFGKPADAKHDWEIFAELGERLAAQLGQESQPVIPPHVMVDQALQHGPYGKKRGHEAALDLEKVAGQPHGIDLGPLIPCIRQRLATENGRIQCAPQPLLDDLERLERRPPANDGLVLIGRRHLRSNNSWMHNYRRLVKGKPACVLLMHPDDSSARKLEHGQEVGVFNKRGCIRVILAVSEDVKPGVVCMPHGFGHQRAGVRLSVASEVPGANINELTDHEFLDELSGNAALNGVPVNVEA